MLLVGANDGQLHAFDAGIWDSGTETFTDGTGKEIFSYIPRLALPIVRDPGREQQPAPATRSSASTARRGSHDVFIDPAHNGTPHGGGARVAHGRRSAASARAAASTAAAGSTDFTSGYYALDLTHPDKLDGTTTRRPADRADLSGRHEQHRLRLRHAAVPRRPLGVHRRGRHLPAGRGQERLPRTSGRPGRCRPSAASR